MTGKIKHTKHNQLHTKIHNNWKVDFCKKNNSILTFRQMLMNSVLFVDS